MRILLGSKSDGEHNAECNRGPSSSRGIDGLQTKDRSRIALLNSLHCVPSELAGRCRVETYARVE